MEVFVVSFNGSKISPDLHTLYTLYTINYCIFHIFSLYSSHPQNAGKQLQDERGLKSVQVKSLIIPYKL